mmetsp:Transcript_11905/g.39715  ORF Transcript_11905/g.39715 Transcript_11905/m.39715 type:complete len:220 (+) Transcript_11905:380-1039(+)
MRRRRRGLLEPRRSPLSQLSRQTAPPTKPRAPLPKRPRGPRRPRGGHSIRFVELGPIRLTPPCATNAPLRRPLRESPLPPLTKRPAPRLATLNICLSCRPRARGAGERLKNRGPRSPRRLAAAPQRIPGGGRRPRTWKRLRAADERPKRGGARSPRRTFGRTLRPLQHSTLQPLRSQSPPSLPRAPKSAPPTPPRRGAAPRPRRPLKREPSPGPRGPRR